MSGDETSAGADSGDEVTEAATATATDAGTPPPSESSTPPPPSARQAVTGEGVVLQPAEPTPLKAQWVVATVAAAVAADLSLRRPPWNNAAFAILILVVAAGLLASGFIKSNWARLLVVAAPVFAAFAALRADPLLTAFNISAAVALLVGGAAVGHRRSLWDLGPIAVLAEAVGLLDRLVVSPIVAMAEASAHYRRWSQSGNNTVRGVVRGLVIAAPIVLILGSLLASADVVFQSFFTRYDIGADNLLAHLMLFVLGLCAMIALLRFAASETPFEGVHPQPRLGAVEAGVILAAMSALFAMFAAAQLVTVLGGADEALARAGLDPKEFARQGFFQLIWVAVLTLAVLMAIRTQSRDERARKVTTIGGLVTVALTLVVVFVAFSRILFYVDDSGLTSRRLYAFVITGWIAVAFVLLAVRLWGVRSDRAWLLPAVALTALVCVLGLDLVNPQRLVAENNLARDEQVLVYHVNYGQFHGEGVARLLNGLDRLSPDLAEEVEHALCQPWRWDRSLNEAEQVTRTDGTPEPFDDEVDDGGWLSRNWGWDKAETARLAHCLDD